MERSKRPRDKVEEITCFFFSIRERLAEVHDEYEEREKRWSRIASLLDRQDLISTSTVSTGETKTDRFFSHRTDPIDQS